MGHVVLLIGGKQFMYATGKLYNSYDYTRCQELIGCTPFFSSGFKEPVINREASNFISEHYNELVQKAKEMGVDASKAEDIVQDVTVSILRAEEIGEGYDMTKGNQGDSIISVRQFIFGRLKGYSKNKEYRKPTEGSIAKPDGNGYYINEIPSSESSSDLDKLSACQKAYSLAADYDTLSDVEDMQAFEEELDYILQFDRAFDNRLSAFLKNIEYFKENIESVGIGGLLDKVRDFGFDFKEAFTNVVKFSSINYQVYSDCLNRAIARAY